jgi:hypothetical protein
VGEPVGVATCGGRGRRRCGGGGGGGAVGVAASGGRGRRRAEGARKLRQKKCRLTCKAAKEVKMEWGRRVQRGRVAERRGTSGRPRSCEGQMVYQVRSPLHYFLVGEIIEIDHIGCSCSRGG